MYRAAPRNTEALLPVEALVEVDPLDELEAVVDVEVEVDVVEDVEDVMLLRLRASIWAVSVVSVVSTSDVTGRITDEPSAVA